MAGYWPFLALFLLGGVACVRQRLWSLPWLAVHTCMLATVLTAVIFWGSARFRDANVGMLMLYAALGLQWLAASRRSDASASVIMARASDPEPDAEGAHARTTPPQSQRLRATIHGDHGFPPPSPNKRIDDA